MLCFIKLSKPKKCNFASHLKWIMKSVFSCLLHQKPLMGIRINCAQYHYLCYDALHTRVVYIHSKVSLQKHHFAYYNKECGPQNNHFYRFFIHIRNNDQENIIVIRVWTNILYGVSFYIFIKSSKLPFDIYQTEDGKFMLKHRTSSKQPFHRRFHSYIQKLWTGIHNNVFVWTYATITQNWYEEKDEKGTRIRV